MSATRKLRRCLKRGHKVDWSRWSHSAAVLDVVDGEVFYPAVYECKRCGVIVAEHVDPLRRIQLTGEGARRMSIRSDLQRMERVVKHVQKMPQADRVWLMQRLTAVECGDIPVSEYLQVGWRDVVQEPRLGATRSNAP